MIFKGTTLEVVIVHLCVLLFSYKDLGRFAEDTQLNGVNSTLDWLGTVCALVCPILWTPNDPLDSQ